MKKILPIIAGVVVLAGVIIAIVSSQPKLAGGKTDADIRVLYDCNRANFDARETDKYCADPQIYRDEVATGKTPLAPIGK